MGKYNLFNKHVGKIRWPRDRVKPDFYHTPQTKVNSRLLKDSNIKAENIKLLDENIGHKLLDIGLSSILGGLIP